MPTINIPPLARFILYILGALLLLFVAYAVDKSWAGDAEVRLVTGVCALLNVLAAAKTNLSDTDFRSAIRDGVGDAVNGAARAGLAGRAPRDRGAITLGTFLLVVLAVVIVLAIVRVL